MAEYLRNRGFLKGVDISNWQPNINYQALKNAGVEIAIIKATEANYYKDPYMEKHYNGCKSVGIKVGFYHFFRCNVDAKAQAQYFVNYIQGKSYDVKLVLDIESTEGQSKSTITNMARTFLEEVQRLTGTQPMIYTYTSFANSCLDGSLSVYPKWIAQYSPLNPNPCSLCDSNGWDGFQFASDGLIANSGYTNLDINEFKPSVYVNGSPVSTSGGNVQSNNVNNGTIKYSNDVLELQKILNSKGHGLVEDGLYGSKTSSAVKCYTIELFDRGNLTKWVQDSLNKLGCDCGYADGYAEQPTMDGIARFQKAHSLGIGRLGSEDWDYLVNDLINNNTQNNLQVSQSTSSNGGRVWDYQYDAQILELQQILRNKGYNIVCDGKMGEETYSAICNFSFDHGDRGELTKWVQKRLNSLGFNCGTPDGIFGNNSVNAMHAWQRANGLDEGKMYASDFYWLCR